MTTFPLELVRQILSLANGATLRSCSIVNKYFCVLSQEFLFYHLHLQPAGETGLARCDFFLAKENRHLSSRVRKLSIVLDNLPVFEGDTVPTQLTELLIQLGPQIYALQITGTSEAYRGRHTAWMELSPVFRNCLSDYVMPYLKSLELPEFLLVHISEFLRNTPLLRHLHLDSGHHRTSPSLAGEDSEFIFPRGLMSFSVGMFEELDFQTDHPLKRVIECSEGTITSFHLGTHWLDLYPLSLDFLSPFPGFTSHILRFSIGDDVFYEERAHDLLNLTMFPRLETFSCPMCFQDRSPQWFNWVAKSLHRAILVQSSSILPLKRIQFTSAPKKPMERPAVLNTLENELNGLAHNPALACSLEFSVPISEGQEKVQSIFADLREFFPSWDQMGRLKLCVEC
ncbi:hypothetical protein DL96DRAFT_1704246 [Flagelloscypha sp. PMI_526]|nr:hypothetical protein DL96DRAFT_1704246 [Flagelloscypha sp. PMI_526]